MLNGREGDLRPGEYSASIGTTLLQVKYLALVKVGTRSILGQILIVGSLLKIKPAASLNRG